MSNTQPLGPTQLETLAALQANCTTTAEVVRFIQEASGKTLASGGLRRTLSDLCEKGYATSETVTGQRAKQYAINAQGTQACQAQLEELNKVYTAAFHSNDISQTEEVYSIPDQVGAMEVPYISEDTPLNFSKPSFANLKIQSVKSGETLERLVVLHKNYNVCRYTYKGVAALMLESIPANWYNRTLDFLNQEPSNIEKNYFYLDAASGNWIQVMPDGEEQCSLEFDFFTKQLLRIAVVS